VIPAGGSGKLVAKVKTRVNQNGKLSKAVTVTTDAPGQESLRLTLSFTVEAAIVVKPRPQIFVDAIEGIGGSARILMHRPDGETLTVNPLRDGLPEHVQVRVYEVTEADAKEAKLNPRPGDLWIEASVTDQSPVINTNTTLALATNHPKLPRFNVQLALRVKPRYAVRPTRVAVSVYDDGSGSTSAAVRVTSAEREPFEISKIEVSHPELFSATAASKDARSIHTLRIRGVSGLDPQSIGTGLRGKLSISLATTPPEELEVEVTLRPGPPPKHSAPRQGARRPIPTPAASGD
jgi:hypothetical protein